MTNISFKPGQTIEMKCNTPFVYNAICEAIYEASKNRITIHLWIGDFCMCINTESTAKHVYTEYEQHMSLKNT